MTQQHQQDCDLQTTVRQRNATLPAYHRLYVLLSEGIKNSEFPPGDLLPPEQTLAKRYDVSRVTVRKALQHLVEDGFIIKRQGQGNIVTLAAHSGQNADLVSGLIANLVAQGVKSKAETLLWEFVTPNSLVQQKLNLRLGEKSLLIRRVRSLGAQPISYGSIYLPESVGRILKPRRATHKLVLQMLDGTPFAAHHTEHSLSATLADGEAANLLGLPAGAPMLRMRGVAYTKRDEPVYFQESVYHPDRYEYAVKLNRDNTSTKFAWRSDDA